MRTLSRLDSLAYIVSLKGLLVSLVLQAHLKTMAFYLGSGNEKSDLVMSLCLHFVVKILPRSINQEMF